MRDEATATSVVATGSVAVAVLGHAVAGGAVEPSTFPQLSGIAVVSWLCGQQLAKHRDWMVVVLAAIQLSVHCLLHTAAVPMDHHDLAGQPDLVSGTLSISTAHLVALLLGVALIDHTHQWAQRVLRILARLVPQLPAAAAVVPATVAPRAAVLTTPLTEWRLTPTVSRRGPPAVRALPTKS